MKKKTLMGGIRSVAKKRKQKVKLVSKGGGKIPYEIYEIS